MIIDSIYKTAITAIELRLRELRDKRQELIERVKQANGSLDFVEKEIEKEKQALAELQKLSNLR